MLKRIYGWSLPIGCLAASCLLSGAAAPVARAQADEMKPLAVLSLSGYDALMGDIDFIGSLAGMPQASQFVEMGLAQATQNQGLQGFDKSKPLGLIVQSGGSGSFGGGICLPVTDMDAFLKVLAPFGVASEDLGNGMKQISANGQNLFAQTADGWAKMSIMPHMLEGLPEDPGITLSVLAQDYDLAVRLHMQNIPAPFRAMAVDAMAQGANDALQQNAGESDEDFAARQEQLQTQLAELKRVFDEMDELTLGISIDSEKQRTLFDMTATALPGTKLAEDFALNANPTTNFAGFLQPDAAMMLSFASKVAPNDVSQLDQMLETVRMQAAKAIEEESELPNDAAKETMKGAVDDILAAVKATLQAGVMDGGAVLNMAPDALTFVAGAFIGDPAKVEAALKKIVELGEQDANFPGVTWDAETHANVSFHTMSIPIKESDENAEQAQQLFGEAVEMAIGIGEKSVYVAVGRDCLAAAKEIIDRSQANLGQEVAPMEMTFALGQIVNALSSFADEEQKMQMEMIGDMLANETQGRDHVRISSIVIPNGQRTRIEAEEGVLRAIGMAIMQAQMAGAGF